MDKLQTAIFENTPADGSQIGNTKLKGLLRGQGFTLSDSDYEAARDQLISEGKLAKGRGKGGAVRRTEVDEFNLSVVEKPEGADIPRANKGVKKTSKSRSKANQPNEVISYRHDEKRKNNPHVGMVDTHSDGIEEETTWAYDPHIDPALNFDSERAGIENLIDDALASGDQAQMHAALEQLKRMQSPYLNWAGKAERTSFEVDTVSLHVHERLDPATILAAVQKRIKDSAGKSTGSFQADLFHAPFENLPLREAIDFYKHERDWANRLIAGDSLLVMNSLLQKEGMAGQVQMIYIDPPYGIKYGSNFQPFVGKNKVAATDKDVDLTSEPEMIKAFRDTWELGLHSYLTYLRDRLLLAKELLTESGSLFVQISDENLHHTYELIEEIFGKSNFVSLITIKKTTSTTSNLISNVSDYLIWFAKDKAHLKFHPYYQSRSWSEADKSGYNKLQLSNGDLIGATKSSLEKLKSSQYQVCKYDNLTSDNPGSRFEATYKGKSFWPGANAYWKTDQLGFSRLQKANRTSTNTDTLYYVRKFDDFPLIELNNFWDDVAIGGFGDDKVYVVQTNQKIIQRCLLMCTDPSDLVLDPTCGSGTTAFVAEKWGRRWISCDTSRVALTLTKQRLMTAGYDYYELKYPSEGLSGGFVYNTAPHVMLKDIANNPEIDEIFESMHPKIESALSDLTQVIDQEIEEWEVPFSFPENWPEEAKLSFEEFHRMRSVMRQKMDESIATLAGQEVLYDQPTISKNKKRITGPFTVEAVPFATVLGLDEAEQPKEADVAVARSGATSTQSQWRDELLEAGIRGKGGQKIELQDLAPLPGAKYIHAIGTVKESGDKVAVSFGPEHAALEQRQVEIAMREAGELFPLPKMLVFCAFTFDPEAAKDIDNVKGIAAIKVQMNTDLLTEDLKRGRASNESFWLMGQPDVTVSRLGDDQFQVEVKGFDYFDTKTGELKSGGQKNIAMWALDTDYDNRSLFPRQVFFPMAGSKDGWNKLRKDIRAELNSELLEQFHGTTSLPFEAGDNECIAVKIVDDRGIESLKVIRLDTV